MWSGWRTLLNGLLIGETTSKHSSQIERVQVLKLEVEQEEEETLVPLYVTFLSFYATNLSASKRLKNKYTDFNT